MPAGGDLGCQQIAQLPQIWWQAPFSPVVSGRLRSSPSFARLVIHGPLLKVAVKRFLCRLTSRQMAEALGINSDAGLCDGSKWDRWFTTQENRMNPLWIRPTFLKGFFENRLPLACNTQSW